MCKQKFTVVFIYVNYTSNKSGNDRDLKKTGESYHKVPFIINIEC